MSKLFHSKKLFLAVTATVLTASMLTGCSSESKTDQPKQAAQTGAEQSVFNVWGETKVQGTPAKVVALDFLFIDELSALGVSPVGLAGTGKTQVPEYLAGKVQEYTYVGERKEPNLEIIRSTNPDLIIANPDRHKLIKNELAAIAPTVAFDDLSIKEVLKDTETLGKVLGKEKEAKQVVKDLEAKIKDAKSKIQGKPKVLVIGAFEDEFSVWLKESFIGSLMVEIGTEYPFEGTKVENEGSSEVAILTMEKLAEIDPDFIFVYGDLSKWKDNPLYKSLRVVQENHVLEVDRNLWSRGRGPVAATKILEQGLPLLTGKK